jgi:hypothetical protein
MVPANSQPVTVTRTIVPHVDPVVKLPCTEAFIGNWFTTLPQKLKSCEVVLPMRVTNVIWVLSVVTVRRTMLTVPAKLCWFSAPLMDTTLSHPQLASNEKMSRRRRNCRIHAPAS